MGSSLDCVSNRANCCKGRASVSGVVIGLVRISLIILEGQFDRLKFPFDDCTNEFPCFFQVILVLN